ncbi:MAG: Crp/Fnr family transcriptional regulator [Hyphomonas sp.]|nr:Crp/Fnr family transcriptional regulator [Hyphomonas sp.]
MEFQLWAARAGRWRDFKAGQFIYLAGDTSDGLYGLGSGSLHITFPLIAEEAVIIHRCEVGFWIGDNAELASVPRLVSAAAATDCRIYHLPSRAVQGLLTSDPAHWRAFYALSAINVAIAVTQLSEALALSVRARACRRLLEVSANSPDVGITQDELAKLIGVTRGTMRRCLEDLTALGAIEWRYRNLHIKSREILTSYKDEQ